MSAPTEDTPSSKPSPRPAVWRRPMVLTVAALAVVGLVVVLVIFQPQRLLYDVAVDDEFPAVEDAGASNDPDDRAEEEEATVEVEGTGQAERGEGITSEDDAESEADDGDQDDPAAEDPVAEEPSEPVALATGSFESRNRYTTTGAATAYALPDGTRTLRLEDFETTNGPDLYVYLTAGDASDSDADLDSDFVDLGDLRGNVGNQNYPIPDDVDLDRYDTVVIWCLRFTTSFGVADLAFSSG